MSGKEQLLEVKSNNRWCFLIKLIIFHFKIFKGWKSRDSVPRLVEDYLNKKVKVDEFVSHDVPYEEINNAFHLMHSGQR